MDNNKKNLFSTPFALTILVGALLILGWGLWTVPLMGINEGRRALTALEMVRNGNWLIPTMNGHIYIDKPPLLYWLMAISAKVFQSTAEWVLRLPAALAALAICGMLFRSTKKYLGQDIAILAILILATSLSFTGSAHRAEIEIILTFFCFAANLFFLDYYISGKNFSLWLSYLCIGLAILTKGPVALLFFIPPLVVFGLVKPSGRTWRGLLFWPGWLLMLLVGGSWYIAIWFSEAGPLLRQVIEIDIVGKSLGGLSDSKPFYRYFVNLLGIFAPWILLPIFRSKKIKTLFNNPAATYFALQTLIPLVIMSLIASKHNKYILPLFPALAICLAIYLRDFYKWIATRYQERGKKYFTFFSLSLMALYLIFYAALEPRIYNYRFSAFEPLLAKLYEVQDRAPLYCLCENKFLQLVFYYNQPIPDLSVTEIKKMITEQRPFLLLLESRALSQIPQQGLEIIMELKPYRSKDRAVTLLTNLTNWNLKKPYKVISHPVIPEIYSTLDKKLHENSGLIFFDDNAWTFNDSGGEPAIYRIDNNSEEISQTVTLENAENRDWEDIAQDDNYIYLSDSGNNSRNKHNFTIYKICKKNIAKEKNCKVKAELIKFSYTDHRDDIINSHFENNNCEALISFEDSLIIFTKTWGRTKMYKLPKVPGTYQLDPIAKFATDGLISGATFNSDTGELILLGSKDIPFIYIFSEFNGENFTSGDIKRINLNGMKGSQPEGICWIDNDNILISTEQTATFEQAIYKVNIRDILKPSGQ